MEIQLFAWIGMFLIVFLISIAIIYFYYYIDEFEPESILDLLGGVFLGIIAILPVYFIFSFLPISNEDVFSIIVGPIIEELVKAGFLLFLIRRDNVDGPIDGFIYGAMLGIGFSLGENFLYGMSEFYNSGSLISGITIAGIRSLLSVVGHPLYTGLFGLGLGKYKVQAKESVLDEFGLALGSHIIWNFSIQLDQAVLRFFVTFAVVLLLFFIFYHKLRDGLELDQYAFSQGYYRRKDQLLVNDNKDKISELQYPLKEE